MTFLRAMSAWLLMVTALAPAIVALAADSPPTPGGEVRQGALYAIAAQGKDAAAPVYFLAARATHYHLYDENGNLVEVIENPYLGKDMEIGPAAARMLADRGVTVLVAGMAGPKMMDVLVARQVRFVARRGAVQGVVDELRR